MTPPQAVQHLPAPPADRGNSPHYSHHYRFYLGKQLHQKDTNQLSVQISLMRGRRGPDTTATEGQNKALGLSAGCRKSLAIA